VYCSKCGSAIAETVAVCPVCGQSQVAGYAPSAPPLVRPAGPAEVTPHWQPAPVVAYAGFWLRFVAALLDGLILGLPVLIIFVIIMLSTGFPGILHSLPRPPDPPEPNEIATALGAVIIPAVFAFISIAIIGKWLYFALFESSSWQATPGKKVLNIFVTDINGTQVSFGRASGRYFSKFISSLIPLGIGYVLAGLTERKQALHDMIANTYVLRR
jgi:uncharacterized RDD family membrane protein YckC